MKKIIISFAVACAALSAAAQDMRSSQPYTAPLQLNPALMGPNQDIRANIGYRSQWADIDGFQTMRANVMMPVYDTRTGQVDVGLAYVNDGYGAFTTNDIKLAVGYDLQLERAHHLSLALQSGYGMREFDFGSQTWDDQYAYGQYEPSLQTAEVLGDEKASWVDAGFGLLYYYTPPRDSISVYVGVSGQHVYNPKESYLQNGDGVYQNKYSAMAGVKVMTKEHIDITPNVIATRQGGAQDISVGLYADYKVPMGWGTPSAQKKNEDEENVVMISTSDTTDAKPKWPKKPFIEKQDPRLAVGAWYHQHSKAVSLMLGVRFDKFAVGYSYDFSPAVLRDTGFGNSSHEVTLSFMMPWGLKSVGQVVPIW